MNALSIDFDFWVPEKIEYDWGHAENMALFFGYMWQIRAGHALARGVDLRKEMPITADCGVDPFDFPAWMKDKGVKLGQKAVAISDSHAAGGLAFGDCSNLDILHIDAHHDCGYGVDNNEAKKLDCGNWIETLVQARKVRSVDIIYPSWRKGQDEYGDSFLAKIARWEKELKVSVTIYHGLDSYNNWRRTFSRVILCRSGAWVPPWFDDTFVMLAKLLLTVFKQNNFALYQFDSIDHIKREFDWNEVAKQGEQYRELLKTMQGQQGKGWQQVV